jgi:hypothetical protein
MNKEERRNLLWKVVPWRFKELTPQWFLVYPGGFSIMHICRPGTWVKLAEDPARGFNSIYFSPYKDFKCNECKEALPKYLIPVVKLLVLGDKICG